MLTATIEFCQAAGKKEASDEEAELLAMREEGLLRTDGV